MDSARLPLHEAILPKAGLGLALRAESPEPGSATEECPRAQERAPVGVCRGVRSETSECHPVRSRLVVEGALGTALEPLAPKLDLLLRRKARLGLVHGRQQHTDAFPLERRYGDIELNGVPVKSSS